MTKPVLQTAQEMLDFIARAPSCFHVIAQFCGQLEADGWQRLEEGQRWQLAPGGRYYVTRNGSTLAAFRLPASAPTGLMLAAAHSDAPTFKLKHSAELADGTYLRLDTEPYGSGIWASWLDRPLSAAGRAAVRTETGVETRLVDLGEDLFLIPSLAIHLDRKINEGRALNAQVDLLPLFGQAGERGALAQKIAAAAGVSASYLSRIFRKDTGIHLQDYIIDIRIDRAANLLKYSDLPLSEIAAYVNFPSHSYFGKAFKAKYHMTPKEFRDRYTAAEWNTPDSRSV